jgi:uncharacterized protein (TIGR03437 family)
MSLVRILFVALFVPLIPAWPAQVSIAPYSGSAGSSIVAAISFASQGTPVSGIQLDLAYDSSQMSTAFLIADGGRINQKLIYASNLGTNGERIIIVGMNRNPLPDGPLVTVFVNLKASAQVGRLPLTMSQVVCSDPDGQSVRTTTVEGNILVTAASPDVSPIAPEGVLNAASLRSGPIAPGEIITLIGSSIGPANPAQNQGKSIGTTLGGTRLLLNGIPSPLLYASSNQINAVVPYAVSGPSADLAIETAGQKLRGVTLPVASVTPAIFTLNSTGVGAGAILNEDYSVNTPSNPASRGSVVSLFATGAGQMNPPTTDAQLGDATALGKPVLPVSIEINGSAVDPLYAGAAPGLISGMIQVNFRVPDSVLPTDAVPISIQIGSVGSPSGVTIAVK